MYTCSGQYQVVLSLLSLSWIWTEFCCPLKWGAQTGMVRGIAALLIKGCLKYSSEQCYRSVLLRLSKLHNLSMKNRLKALLFLWFSFPPQGVNAILCWFLRYCCGVYSCVWAVCGLHWWKQQWSAEKMMKLQLCSQNSVMMKLNQVPFVMYVTVRSYSAAVTMHALMQWVFFSFFLKKTTKKHPQTEKPAL